MQLAAQLYTVRDLLARDFAGTLRKIRSIGYLHVEMAGHGAFSARELQNVLSDCGLTACSDHCPIERLHSDLSRAVDEALTLRVKYLVCPYIPAERRCDKEGWLACARILNDAGRRCREQGIQLCYHHHSFEFVDLKGRTALELLFDETDPAAVQAELDTYWIAHGGANPVDWLARLEGRCTLLHLKDMARDEARSFAPVRTGILDWPGILSAAERAGVEWGIVEQDTCEGDPLECLATSLQNLRAKTHTRCTSSGRI
jgi:sugar phosphate isomerase/epimerase